VPWETNKIIEQTQQLNIGGIERRLKKGREGIRRGRLLQNESQREIKEDIKRILLMHMTPPKLM